MGERRVLRELPRASRTAQRETEGRNARTVTELTVIIHPLLRVRRRRDLRAEPSEYTCYGAASSLSGGSPGSRSCVIFSTTAVGMWVTARNPSPSGRTS